MLPRDAREIGIEFSVTKPAKSSEIVDAIVGAIETGSRSFANQDDDLRDDIEPGRTDRSSLPTTAPSIRKLHWAFSS